MPASVAGRNLQMIKIVCGNCIPIGSREEKAIGLLGLRICLECGRSCAQGKDQADSLGVVQCAAYQRDPTDCRVELMPPERFDIWHENRHKYPEPFNKKPWY